MQSDPYQQPISFFILSPMHLSGRSLRGESDAAIMIQDQKDRGVRTRRVHHVDISLSPRRRPRSPTVVSLCSPVSPLGQLHTDSLPRRLMLSRLKLVCRRPVSPGRDWSFVFFSQDGSILVRSSTSGDSGESDLGLIRPDLKISTCI